MYITPNDTIGKSDSESISLAIEKAKADGINKVLIPKRNNRANRDEWIIEQTIYLPGDFELVIDNALLTLDDGVYINMFASENVLKSGSQTKDDRLHNITIKGIGNAVLSGGNYNGLSERTSETGGRPHISKNTMILAVNVSNLRIENIKIEKQRWWGITNVFVDNSYFGNICFNADFSRVDENGVHYPNQIPQNYEEVYVKNADGIDLRVGCHNIIVENITGFTEDDSVALTALGGFESKLGYMVAGADADIHDVKIKNISTDSYVCANVRLLCENGYKVYNIDIDGVSDMRRKNEYKAQYNVRLGDSSDAYASISHAKIGDMHDISVRNVYGNGSYAVGMCKSLVNVSVDNIICGKDCMVGFGFYHTHLRKSTVENLKTGNIYCENELALPLFLENDRNRELTFID